MPGMGTSLNTHNPTIVAAFQSALLRQGLVAIAFLALLAIAWNVLRAAAYRRGAPPHVAGQQAVVAPEPAARRLLRIGFGCLWLFDGVLQGQASMPLGFASGVIAPAGASSPSWVRHLAGVSVTTWNDHPVTAAAAGVWIQVGIGLLLLVAPRGAWSRFAGLAAMSWGLVVWAFGESFGGLLGGGVTWLFGAPGAAFVYAVAGGLVCLREGAWTARLGRRLLFGMGLFYLAMALLQAWPGRGFWQGSFPGGAPGTLTGMIRDMAATPQPGWLARLVRDFSDLIGAHGFAVNLVAVVLLAAVGLAFCSGRRRALRWATVANAVLCVADWVLVEDLGFLGGVGTDPNTMLPFILLATAGLLASRGAAVAAAAPAPAAPPPGVPWRARLAGLLDRPAFLLRSLAALGAVVLLALGAVPMAVASLNPVADPILTEAIDGAPSPADFPLLSFSLQDQRGTTVTAASLRRKAVLLTFLDPVCTTDCPVIAQELKRADAMLGALAGRVEIVAVVANPLYHSLAAIRAFDATEGLSSLPNWLYLTGPVPVLQRLWANYDVAVAVAPGGAMVQHADIAYLIDPHGRVREILNSDPGPSSAASESSFSGVVVSSLEKVLP